MSNYLYLNWFYLRHNNRVPYLSLCSKFYVQFVISTVKSRQISNIHTHRFLLKCKNNLILPTDQSKSPKKTIKTLSWNYSYVQHDIKFYCIFNTVSPRLIANIVNVLNFGLDKQSRVSPVCYS